MLEYFKRLIAMDDKGRLEVSGWHEEEPAVVFRPTTHACDECFHLFQEPEPYDKNDPAHTLYGRKCRKCRAPHVDNRRRYRHVIQTVELNWTFFERVIAHTPLVLRVLDNQAKVEEIMDQVLEDEATRNRNATKAMNFAKDHPDTVLEIIKEQERMAAFQDIGRQQRKGGKR